MLHHYLYISLSTHNLNKTQFFNQQVSCEHFRLHSKIFSCIHTAWKCARLAICTGSSIGIQQTAATFSYPTEVARQAQLSSLFLLHLQRLTKFCPLLCIFLSGLVLYSHLCCYATAPKQSLLLKFPFNHHHVFFMHGWTSSSSTNLEGSLCFAPLERPNSARRLAVNFALYLYIYTYI